MYDPIPENPCQVKLSSDAMSTLWWINETTSHLRVRDPQLDAEKEWCICYDPNGSHLRACECEYNYTKTEKVNWIMDRGWEPFLDFWSQKAKKRRTEKGTNSFFSLFLFGYVWNFLEALRLHHLHGFETLR